MNKIKVLQVIAELGDGGVETMLINLYNNIDKGKFEFIFVVQNDRRKYKELIENNGGKIIEIKPLKEIGLIKYIKALKKICINEKINVVHCHNLTQNPIILFAAFISGVKIRVSHSHLTTCFSKKAELFMPLIRLSINLFATDKLACGYEAGKFLYGKTKFDVINNAIDIDKFINNENRLITNIPIDLKGKYILLHVGRLSIQKNHGYLIEIMKKLKDEPIVCLCCGTGPLMEDIQKKIQENNLNNIILLGSRNDISDLMNNSNLLLLPSLYEGLPVTVIESQASGLKAIVANTVDKACDLGLNLVDFLPIDNNNLNDWVNKILFYKNNGYSCNNNIYEVLTQKGYNSKINSKKITKIYEK